MRLLTLTTLYPNAARPNHGVFVETRLRHLLQSGRIQARVVAPTPWFPSKSALFGHYAATARAPRLEVRYGVDIDHPRYLAVPKVGMSIAPFLLAAGAYSAMNGMIQGGYDPDIIDAHYFYPDGVAAAIIGKRLRKPVVITARGSDVNLLPQFALPRRMILWAARRAAALITVSSALKETLIALGVDGSKITVLRNGVDTDLFAPADRALHRARLGLTGRVLLMVGNLVPLKGHELVLRALAYCADASLVVIGEGSEEKRLKMLATHLQVQDRVSFLGAMSQQQLSAHYVAADALVLASSREGWPNVLLESMACGTPVVAACVGGIPEIVAAPEAGVVMTDRSVQGVVQALHRLFQNYPDRKLTRSYAERFGWDYTTRGQLELFDRILGRAG